MALALALAPGLAGAADGLHPRTPAIFPDAPCMVLHDRAIDPIFPLTYTIPYEDTEKTPDEVADSRTHQFIAFCRDHHPQDPLVNWISTADIAAAAAMDPPLIDPMTVPESEVFETSAAWQGCWYRLNGDDERRPITFAAAAEPVLWDTTGLPAGQYVIEGYTWEPPYNLWSPRAGVIKIFDGDPDTAPPALAVTNLDEILWSDQSVAIQGCFNAVDGATLTAYWSLTDFDKIAWKPFAVDVPIAGESFAVDFAPPPETAGESVMIRVDITDPMDRTSTTYMTYLITVLDGVSTTSGGDDTCGGSFIDGGECTAGSSGGGDTSGGATTAADGSAADTSTGPAVDDGGGEGSCACHAEGRSPAALAWVALVGLAGIGRRRRV